MRNFRQTTQIILWITFINLLTSCFNDSNEVIKPGIIPEPLSQQINEGSFLLDRNTSIIFDKEFSQIAEFTKAFIENGSKIKLSVNKTAKTISFIKDEVLQGEEAYQLLVKPKGIIIKAKNSRGAFYGFQSLRQLLPATFENATFKNNAVSIQNIEIKDAPRFKYRGMHLDVGRHFFSVDFIKKFTFLSKEEIERLITEHNEAPHMRLLQKTIAKEVTILVHSEADYDNAVKASSILFGKSTADDLKSLDEQTFLDVFSGVPQAEVSKSQIEQGLDIVAAFAETGFLKSNGEVRRALKENSISVNKEKVKDGFSISNNDLIADSYVLLQRGKKSYFLLKVVS